MKLKFFERVAEARTDVPSLTIRRMDKCNFNKGATELLNLELGEAVNLAYDEESRQWVLAYFPQGATQHCALRTQKGYFGFSHSVATKAFFAALPKELAQADAVRVPVGQLLENKDIPEGQFYLLDLGLTVRNDITVIAPAKKRKGGSRG